MRRRRDIGDPKLGAPGQRGLPAEHSHPAPRDGGPDLPARAAGAQLRPTVPAHPPWLK
jgi:hypothetical protein